MMILACGPHESADPAALSLLVVKTLDNLHARIPIRALVEGEARLVDTFARLWAKEEGGIKIHRHPADWETYGRSAGHRRNAEMLARDPDLVLAISDVPISQTRGTRNMLHQAQRANYPTMIVAPETDHRATAPNRKRLR